MRIRLSLSLAVVSLLALGCPKDEPVHTPTPVPVATTDGAVTMMSPVSSATPAPVTTPITTLGNEQVDTSITYKWGGGLSIYRNYELSIQGGRTAKVVFRVAPVRSAEKTVEDTLTEEQFSELKRIFADVKFDDVQTQPRKVRIMDIGQTEITRTTGGKTKTVMENPVTTATTDIKPLRKWFDERVRKYLETAGVAPATQATPGGSGRSLRQQLSPEPRS